MNRDLIKKARQANLAKYLIDAGIPLIRNGNRYKHSEHDSLTFTENAYYWNSRQEHGNAIDYLVKYMNMDFIAAVDALTNSAREVVPLLNNTVTTFDISQILTNPDTQKVKTYLYRQRKIGHDTIEHLIENNLLQQEQRTNNALFLIYDEKNQCVGAEMQGITAKRFKGIKANSKYGYGFNIRISDDNCFDYALFFESAIDLISFMDYKQNYEKKPLSRCLLISMSGLKLNVVRHMTSAFAGKPKPVICVDNDAAGDAFIADLEQENVDFMLCRPDDSHKDWNDQIAAIKSVSTPIARLMQNALMATDQIWKTSVQNGTDIMTTEEIDAEISAVKLP